MKTFSQYLNEQNLESVVVLLEEHNFPFEEMTSWYLTEGYCLSNNELKQIMEGVWAEAEEDFKNRFWGDTWRGIAKGAGVGAGAGGAAGGWFGGLPGAGIGAGVGGLLGGAAGGLYGAGRNLWQQWRTNQAQKTQTPEVPKTPESPKADYTSLFKQLAQEKPELAGDIDALFAKINRPQEPKREPQEPQSRQPLPRHPDDISNLHPYYQKRSFPIGDHVIP